MPEKNPYKQDRSPEERKHMFSSLVQLAGIGVGGDEEYQIRSWGRTMVKFHEATTDEERKLARLECDGALESLGELGKINTKVAAAIVNLTFAEVLLFPMSDSTTDLEGQ